MASEVSVVTAVFFGVKKKQINNRLFIRAKKSKKSYIIKYISGRKELKIGHR